MGANKGSGARRVASATATRDTNRYVVTRRPRRWFALLGLVPLIGGVIETNSRIEDDLEAKALALGATAADFSAQSGTVCADDFDAFAGRLRDAAGVGSVKRGDDCEPDIASEPTASSGPASDSTSPPATVPTTVPATEPTVPADDADIVDTLVADGSFVTLTTLLGAAGLEDALRGPGPTTVFAPTDAAFAALDPALVASLEADPELLSTVLSYHVVAGAVRAADLTSGQVTSLSGETLNVTVGDEVTIDADGTESATVVTPDVEASNGVIHIIDTVLIPPSLRASAAAASALDAVATFDGAIITLTGTVDDESQRAAIVDGAIAAMGGDATKVVDQLTVAGTSAGDAVVAAGGRAAQLGSLLATFPTNFASGEAAVSDVLSLQGVTLDDAALAAAEADGVAAGAAPSDISVEVRPEATAADRDRLIADINALFVDRTIQFAQSSAEILPESDALLDDAAARLRQFDLSGIVITIEGHTDADGSSESNLALSQSRAEAVEQALVDRGIAPDALTPIGFGEDQPIAPNDTPDNKALNRRVTFSAQQ